jgi:histidinol-phosphate aminotransferase
MSISRRAVLRHAGLSAVASTVIPLLGDPVLSGPASAGVIHLDRNENAYGPSEKAISAMRAALTVSNRFPSFEDDELVGRIAALHKIRPEVITLGAGSTEIQRMAAAAFLTPGKNLILASPTFNTIAHFAADLGCDVVAVPLTKRYAHDLEAMLARINGSTGLIYICNPNNPTGTLTVRNDIDAFLRQVPAKPYVLIDEAYHEYVNSPSTYASFIDRPIYSDRVIVSRTFSKIYGLAGARVGYAVSSPEVSRNLSRNRLPFGINMIGARGAAAAVDDADYVQLSAQRNMNNRQEFFNQANGRMNRWIDSHTNFVMMKGGLPPQQIIDHFQQQHISLGPVVPDMPTYVRISIGKPEEMLEFWRVWDKLPAHPMPM